MENALVESGLSRLGIELRPGAVEQLGRYADALLQWNAKVNLTAITRPDEVAEKHLVDSLAILPDLPLVPGPMLDLGAGAGLPGIPLAIALPGLEVTLVDAVAKKVGFLKHVVAQLALFPRVKAVHARVEGQPAVEKLSLSKVVISRAFMDLERWLPLANSYVAPHGRVAAMLGQAASDEQMRAEAAKHGLYLHHARRFALPVSGDPRAVAVFGRLADLDEPVGVLPPLPDGPSRFEAEASRLRGGLPAGVRLEHVGSSAVPGLAGSGVIDIAAGGVELADHALEQLGYQSLGLVGPGASRLFRLRSTAGNVDVLVADPEGEWWNDAVRVRDYLRATPDAAHRWAEARQAGSTRWLEARESRAGHFAALVAAARR